MPGCYAGAASSFHQSTEALSDAREAVDPLARVVDPLVVGLPAPPRPPSREPPSAA